MFVNDYLIRDLVARVVLAGVVALGITLSAMATTVEETAETLNAPAIPHNGGADGLPSVWCGGPRSRPADDGVAGPEGAGPVVSVGLVQTDLAV